MTQQIINNRYHIIKKLGEGGMGAVFLANDSLYDGRKVALKTIRPEIAKPKLIDQFRREFEIMTRLKHPNLAQVYNFGQKHDDKAYFLTMEYVSQMEYAQPTPARDQTTVQSFWEGLDGMTMEGIVEAVDGWYGKNPNQLDVPVLVVIWNEIVEPKLDE